MSSETRDARPLEWLHQHWITPLALVPFAILVAIHRFLDLPQNIMLKAAEGEVDAQNYNAVMMLAGLLGSLAYLGHAFALGDRNAGALVLKLLFFAILWGVVMIVFQDRVGLAG